MAVEGRVVVPPDSSGKSIRTLEVTVMLAGVPTLVEMQVVGVASPDGEIVDLASTLDQLIQLLRIQNGLLRGMVFQLSMLNSPRVAMEDLAPFINESVG
jgi:hypothetical protein